MMHSIDALLIFYRERMAECEDERDKAAHMAGKRITDEDRKRAADVWETERQVARDTLAYLQTIQRRGLSADARSETGAAVRSGGSRLGAK